MSIDNEIESSVSDVPAESSPAPETTEVSESAAPAQAEAAPKTNNEQYVPYERFKELVEQKNQFSKQVEENQRALKELQAKFESAQPKPASPTQKLAQRLKEIDPEFGGTFEELLKDREELKAWRTQQEQNAKLSSQQQLAQQANSSLDSIKTELKASPAQHERIRAQLMIMGQADPRLGVQDIPRIYKQLHEAEAKEREEYKRSVLAEYTSSKSTDSKVPTAGKGAAPKAPAKFEYSSDPELARQQMVKHAMDQMKSRKS